MHKNEKCETTKKQSKYKKKKYSTHKGLCKDLQSDHREMTGVFFPVFEMNCLRQRQKTKNSIREWN